MYMLERCLLEKISSLVKSKKQLLDLCDLNKNFTACVCGCVLRIIPYCDAGLRLSESCLFHEKVILMASIVKYSFPNGNSEYL